MTRAHRAWHRALWLTLPLLLAGLLVLAWRQSQRAHAPLENDAGAAEGVP